MACWVLFSVEAGGGGVSLFLDIIFSGFSADAGQVMAARQVKH